ncbi:small hydrophilic protein [Streptomyces coelicoflavus ZG0656]|nr:small hydrophilic protein [Streptomyces coelicoflavus ZG0656]MZE47707.1 small hydrophilic protein [Streptomyces sp. SID5477]
MSASGETRARLQQMRDKAQELQAASERAGDPDERKRLQEKARRLQSQSEEESMERGGDIYPPA